MKDIFADYIRRLYQGVPTVVYVGLAIAFFIGALLMFVIYGNKKGLLYSCRILLAEYLILLFCSTVLFRPYSERRGNMLLPFWSYSRENLIIENMMNVMVFISVGLLLGIVSKQMTWWKVLTIGCCISASIEVLQFCLKRGFSEVDDVMHNTMGCMIGYSVYAVIRLLTNTQYKNV